MPGSELIDAFRTHYHRLVSEVQNAINRQDDSTVIARLGDDVDEYANSIAEVCTGLALPIALLRHCHIAHTYL
jgi:hypothetical protein